MMKPRPGIWRTEIRDTSSITTSYIIIAFHVSFDGAFPFKKVRRCSSTFMRGFLGIIFVQEHGEKGISAWFLLANDRQRCDSDREIL
jgi:hypothetical protein